MASKDDLFVRTLIEWYDVNKRDFPWRNEDLTAFQVLLAELMLQKTNATQVLKIYPTLIEDYPDPQSIAELDESTIAELFQPLGLFNRRARDLKKTVNIIINTKNALVPNDKKELFQLPGVGDYIANAVLCFAFNKKVPIIDANVGRVMKRVYKFPVKSAPSRDKELTKRMESLIPEKNFKQFNYALLDFAALTCLPKNPKCVDCPLNDICDYFQGGDHE